VLLALTIPADRRTDATGFISQARGTLDAFADRVSRASSDATPEELDAVHALEEAAEDLLSPLRRLEHALQGPVAYGILPVFALANAGVAVGGGLGPLLASPVALGVVLGLVIGKPVGIFGLSVMAVKLGLADRPSGVTWRHLVGVSALAGIGFTMSIFIATLAFHDAPVLLASAKLGILLASAVSALLGWALLSVQTSAARRPGS
jgi:NhaA family Na+:H+ antiporter